MYRLCAAGTKAKAKQTMDYGVDFQASRVDWVYPHKK